jgi:hypothetical protein
MAQAIHQLHCRNTESLFANAHDNLGIAYMEEGLIEEAIRHLEGAKIEPG